MPTLDRPALPAGNFPKEVISRFHLSDFFNWEPWSTKCKKIAQKVNKTDSLPISYFFDFDARALEEHDVKPTEISILVRLVKALNINDFGGKVWDGDDSWTPDDRKKLNIRITLIADLIAEAFTEHWDTESGVAKTVLERLAAGHTPKALPKPPRVEKPQTPPPAEPDPPTEPDQKPEPTQPTKPSTNGTSHPPLKQVPAEPSPALSISFGPRRQRTRDGRAKPVQTSTPDRLPTDSPKQHCGPEHLVGGALFSALVNWGNAWPGIMRNLDARFADHDKSHGGLTVTAALQHTRKELRDKSLTPIMIYIVIKVIKACQWDEPLSKETLTPNNLWTARDDEHLRIRIGQMTEIINQICADNQGELEDMIRLMNERLMATKAQLPEPKPVTVAKQPAPVFRTTSNNGSGQNGHQRQELDIVKAGELLLIPINLIDPNPNQPRTYFNADKLTGLAQSLGSIGQTTPIEITKNPDHPERYVIVDGERRYRAAKATNQLQIRAVVVATSGWEEINKRSFAANFCRESHTPLEAARAMKKLKESNHTNGQIGRLIGRPESYVSQFLSLLDLHPDIQRRIEPDCPKKDQLAVVSCVQLARLQQSDQLKALTEAAGQTNRPTAVRIKWAVENRLRAGGAKTAKNELRGSRPLTPADRRGQFNLFLERGYDFTREWKNQNSVALANIFANVPRADFQDCRRRLEAMIADLSTLKEAMDEATFG